MQLRDYQEEAIKKVLESRNITNKQVLVLATGTGKTVIFSHLIDQLIKETGKKALVLAHREELLTQAKDKLLKVNPELKIGIEQAENHVAMDGESCDDHQQNPDVIVASVPTLGRENSTRIQKFNPRDFCVVIVDECHHASNDTYKTIFKYFGLLKKQFGESQELNDWNKDCLLLGVTATPSRNDNKGIDTVFDRVVYEFKILDAIKRSYLSRIRAFKVRTMTDLTGVGKTAGDFNLGQLEEAVNKEERNKLIVKTYKEIVPNQQALIFATGVAHTMELTDAFLKEGIAASFVVGTTEKDVRAKRLIDFHEKRLQVMINMGVLTEGVDIPSVDAVLLARPTQSSILFQQMLGRGTRLYPGKEFLTVIDFVDTTSRQNLQTTASLLGVSGSLDFKGRDILDVQLKLKDLLDVRPDYNMDNLDIDKIQYAIEEVDLLAGLKIPEEVAPFTEFEWYRYDENTYRVNLGSNEEQKKYFSITETITEEFVVKRHTFTIATKSEIVEEYATFRALEDAIRYTDKFIRDFHKDAIRLIDRDAKWKKELPSDKQIEWLKKMRVPEETIAQLSKGDASRLLTKLFNKRKYN